MGVLDMRTVILLTACMMTYNLILLVNQRLNRVNGAQEEKFAMAFCPAPYALTLARLSDGVAIDENERVVGLSGCDRAKTLLAADALERLTTR